MVKLIDHRRRPHLGPAGCADRRAGRKERMAADRGNDE